MISTLCTDDLMIIRSKLVDICEKCGGCGYLPEKEKGFTNLCDCMIAFSYIIELKESLIPMDYWQLSLSELQVSKYLKDFVEYYTSKIDKAATQGKGVLFMGSNGVGKTSLMLEIGKQAIVSGYIVRYFTVQQLVDALKKDLTPLLDFFDDGQFILLDEMDKVYIKKGSNYVTKAVEEFLRRVSSLNKALILCTNYSEETFIEVFGESTISMLRRNLKFIPVEGKDFSNQLQESWEDALEKDYDYMHPNILKMAKKLLAHREREDKCEWSEQLKR